MKMDELMNMNSAVNDMNTSIDHMLSESNTLPKQVYNASHDIILKAFSSEVLMDGTPTETEVNNDSIDSLYLNHTIVPDVELCNFEPCNTISPSNISVHTDGSSASDGMLPNMSREEFLNLIACIPILNERCNRCK